MTFFWVLFLTDIEQYLVFLKILDTVIDSLATDFMSFNTDFNFYHNVVIFILQINY